VPIRRAPLATCLGYLKREAAMHAVPFGGTSMVRQLHFDGAAPAGLARASRKVGTPYDYHAPPDRDELPMARLVRREQTEPYLTQVKDFQEADQ